jgi:hypothetical protein
MMYNILGGLKANPATGGKAVLNDLAFSPDGLFLFITDTW